MMIRIIFVDDEVNVLEGLQRLLRPLRKEWDMYFVDRGQKCLELLSRERFDVVVSDVKMPDIDGVNLLGEVRSRFPSVIRIALSGHSDKRFVMKSMASTHRFLSKPCEPELLKSTVTTACALRDLLGNANLRTLVSGMDMLPSQSNVSRQLTDELMKTDVSISRIAAIIERDPAITAKILHMANSAFFGLRQKVSSITQAVSVLGIDSVKMLLTVTELFTVFEGNRTCKELSTVIYEHSMRVSRYVKELGKAENVTACKLEESLVGGLLHDIGKLVLAWKSPSAYGKVVQQTRELGISCCDAELKLFGATHAEVGAYLLGLWGLADSVVEVTAFHHNPSRTGSSVLEPVTLVHYANAYDSSSSTRNIESLLDSEYFDRSSFSGNLSYWKAICDDQNDSTSSRIA